MPVHTVSDVEPTVKSFARDPNGSLVVLADAFSVVNRKLIIGLAAQYPHELPIRHVRFHGEYWGQSGLAADTAESTQMTLKRHSTSRYSITSSRNLRNLGGEWDGPATNEFIATDHSRA
jgi:hypothetical protein